jgi:superfamily II RNA helicase
MKRLEEFLRQFAAVCKVIRNERRETKFTEGHNLIKRDIVFPTSLYL